MKRQLLPWIALGVLAAAAVPARADFAPAPTVAVSEVSGSFVDNSPTDPAAASLVDGRYVFDRTALEAGSALTLEIGRPGPSSTYRVLVFTGGATGAYLSALTFADSATGRQASWAASDPADGALVAGGLNRFSFLSGGNLAFTAVDPGFVTYDRVLLTFTFSLPGDTLAIDAVANPEPGTLALFGLGAAGLGSFVWRRRRARATKPSGDRA